MKRIYYCEKCGQVYFRINPPKRCNPKGLIEKCDGKEFDRILTENDLK